MFPYVTWKTIDVLGVPLHVFPTLMAMSVITVFVVALRRGRAVGFAREQVAKVALLTAIGAFAGARLFNFVYHPDLAHSSGISSFGGFFGAVIAALLLFRIARVSLPQRLLIADCFAFALPAACMIGRIGCALIHDHPGMRSDSFLAVADPAGSRFDLGLIEALFFAALAALFVILKRYQWPAGFYAALFFSLYAPFRLLLETIRVTVPRYFGWPVDTYAAMLTACIGLGTFIAMTRMRSKTTEEIPHCSHALSRS